MAHYYYYYYYYYIIIIKSHSILMKLYTIDRNPKVRTLSLGVKIRASGGQDPHPCSREGKALEGDDQRTNSICVIDRLFHHSQLEISVHWVYG